MRDLWFAFKTLARSPMLALAVILSLGLGIGANTAMFSLINQLLLSSLPVQKPEELVVVTSPADFKGGRNSTSDAGGMDSIFSCPTFRALERNPAGLQALAAFRVFGANLSLDGKTQSGSVATVSGHYFPVLGVVPRIGRVIEPADDQGAGRPVTVLGHAYWQGALASDPNVLNRPIRINGVFFTVIGIAPKDFQGMTIGSDPDVYVPLTFKPAMTPGWDGRDQAHDFWLYLFGRRLPNTTLAQANAALQPVYHAAMVEQGASIKDRDAKYVQRYRDQALTLKEGRQGASSLRDSARTALLLLFGITGMVLLIAIGNAANLLLARGSERRRELAIRVALGASQAAIIRQLLVEAFVLAFIGGGVGLLFGSWTLNVLISLSVQEGDPGFLSSNLDPSMLLFTLGVAVLTGLLFGVYPAWAAARDSMSGTLKDEGASTTGTRAKARVRRLLVCTQVGVSLALLIPMGLFLKSLTNILKVDLGFPTANVITFGISPELNSYPPDRIRTFIERAEQELAAIPGVTSVTTGMVPLMAGSNWGSTLVVEGRPQSLDDSSHSMFNVIGAGYFRSLGVPLVNGREFTDRDTLASPKVAIVNERFARNFFGDANPIGRKFTQGYGPKAVPDTEIIGVVRDTKYSGVRQENPRLFFTPYRQNKEMGGTNFYVRSQLPEAQIAPEIRRVMAKLDRDLPLENLRTLEDQIARNLRSDQLVVKLCSAFAILATVLAMLGLYGVMAYNVSRRTREFGVRMALGAESGRIRSMVLRDVAIVFGIGVALGLPLAYFIARAAESELYGVKAHDALVAFGAVLVLALAALLAGYLPARRAARLNPVQALRYE